MKALKQWFGLGPYDEYDGYQYHWYNRHYEHSGMRVRFLAGDLLAIDEDENGGDPHPRFVFEISPLQSDIHEFWVEGQPDAKYDIHILNIVFWRWGIYLSVRGRVYA